MSSDVATGRLMKGSEMLMDFGTRISLRSTPVRSSARVLLFFLGLAAPAGRVRGFHVRTGLQLVLAVHHNVLAGSQAFVNQRLAAFDLGDFYWAHLDRLVVLNDEREGAFRPALNYRRGNDRAVGARGEQQAGVDELAGPKAEIVVR